MTKNTYLPQYQQGKTVAAVATPAGEGAIAVLRISGPDAIRVASRIFSGPIDGYRSHTLHTGQILDANGSIIDHVLAAVFHTPRSYTGEETVEIYCHGGSLIARKVLERMIEAGAQMALPGEFTFQAFMNGKLDLAQAEAVQLLIAAKSDLARQSAANQLDGSLSLRISSFQQELTRIAAILEAWVDFPEEGLEFASMEETILSLEEILRRMRHLLATFHHGKIIHEGLSLCILGSPNVGKSSLMNALLGKDRAIVTPIPGTTRDLLEDELRINRLHFRLIDTAGIRETQEPIEQEGVRRSRAAMQSADLLLLMLDASRPLSSDDRSLVAGAPQGRTILIWNKIDLSMPPETIEWDSVVFLSALEGRGLGALVEEIERKIWQKGPPSKEEVVLSSLRHHEALSLAIQSLEALIAHLQKGSSPEFAAFDMRACLQHLSSIIGANVSEDILSSIFSQFCVGK